MESTRARFDLNHQEISSGEFSTGLSGDQSELELNVEVVEDVIAPGGGWWPNHNEAELEAEEAEAVIAPGGKVNHNETQIG